MTDTTSRLMPTTTVSTVDDLASLWQLLMASGGFGRRTLWLIVLDPAGRPAPVVVPIDDLPVSPDPESAGALGAVLAGIADLGAPAVLLTRPGPASVQESDRHWAAALAPLTPEWPVHLATADPVDAAALCLVQALPVP